MPSLYSLYMKYQKIPEINGQKYRITDFCGKKYWLLTADKWLVPTNTEFST